MQFLHIKKIEYSTKLRIYLLFIYYSTKKENEKNSSRFPYY